MLAAGAGTRLRPLTRFRPKALCPVGDRPLLDWSTDRVAAVVGAGADHVAVNAHHLAGQLVEHVDGRAHVSVEAPEALGTAGAVAQLRPWLDGRAALVVNGDTWSTIALAPVLDGWDGDRVRVAVVGATDLVPGVGVVASLLPAAVIATLPHRPAGLYESCWKALAEAGALDVVRVDGRFVACDRPRDYLAANLLVSGGDAVVGAGAVVEGAVVRSVVWPGGRVARGETLVDGIRIGDHVTVLVR